MEHIVNELFCLIKYYFIIITIKGQENVFQECIHYNARLRLQTITVYGYSISME